MEPDWEKLRCDEYHDLLFSKYQELYETSVAMRKLLSDGQVDFGDCQITDKWHKAIDGNDE